MFPPFGKSPQPPDSGVEGPFGPPSGGPPPSDGLFADFSADDLDGFLEPLDSSPRSRRIDDCLRVGLHFFGAMRRH